MPSIARGQANTTSILNWFITANGSPVNAYLVEFRILDISDGLPGDQVFPTSGYEVVTAAPGRFATGSYYAYDSAEVAGWTPAEDSSIGAHRIEWRWKASSAAPYQSGAEDFEVLSSLADTESNLYISVEDVRNAGLDEDTFNDATVLASIELWQALIDRATRQWFKPRTLTILADGNDSPMMPFGVPIISLEYLKLNNDPIALDTAYYRVYSAKSYPDDRRNPRIILNHLDDVADIYTATSNSRTLKFRKGRQNQTFRGVFGFVEEDGSVPLLIQRALLKLVIEKLTNPIYVVPGEVPPTPPPPILAGIIQEEVTDGHRIRYADDRYRVKERRPNSMMGFTNDPEIIEIVKYYRNPIGCATPAHPSHQG